MLHDKIEMRPAYVWTCEECGRDQFERTLVPEFSPEEYEELRAKHGLEPSDMGDWEMMPRTVCCTKCQHYYETYWYSD